MTNRPEWVIYRSIFCLLLLLFMEPLVLLKQLTHGSAIRTGLDYLLHKWICRTVRLIRFNKQHFRFMVLADGMTIWSTRHVQPRLFCCSNNNRTTLLHSVPFFRTLLFRTLITNLHDNKNIF